MTRTMRMAGLALCGIGLALAAPALALDKPVEWRDPDSGCGYWMTPSGGIAPRFKRDGTPDCPDANTGARVVEETSRGLAQGLDTLKREMERLRERFNAPQQKGDPI